MGRQVSDGKTTLAGVFHRLVPAAPGYEQLRVFGLDRSKRYRYTSLEQAIRIGPFGGLMKHVLPVSLNPNGMILRIADSRFTMPSGSELGTATGAALESGITLLPQFRGTGYDKNQRTTTDFGSDVYVIAEM